jgi:pimeloyl-ACP methyl ester carboxylesterase
MAAYPVKSVKLADGRQLSYEDIGAMNGTPVLYFHGVPSSRVDWQVWGSEEMLRRLGIRLIAIDRPGVGLSSFQPNRRLSDWPSDAAALADELELARFSVLGYSGGGPYAAACAAKIPQRLIAAAMVSSVAPFGIPGILEGIEPANVKFLMLSLQKPWLFRLMYSQVRLITKFAPQQYLKRAVTTFGAADRAVFARPQVHNAILAAGGSGRGQQMDTAIVIGNWDIDLRDITIPVQVWHGDQDRNASSAMHNYLVQNISGARPTSIPGEGHISLIVNHAEKILQGLV